jgi:hypothetical protein
MAIAFLPGAMKRIGSVQQSEALRLIPERTRHLRIALFAAVACLLIPLLTISLVAHHPAALVFGMTYLVVMMLGFLSAPFDQTSRKDNPWRAFFAMLPMLLLPLAGKLGLYVDDMWPLLLTGSLAIGGILWRYRQIGRADIVTKSLLQRLPIPRAEIRAILLKASIVLLSMLFYFHMLKSPGAATAMTVFASSLGNSHWSRNDLRLRWLNGMDRQELFRLTCCVTLREHVLCCLSICAAAGLFVWLDWMDSRWTAFVLIALAFATPAVLVGQIIAITYMDTRKDPGNAEQRNLAVIRSILISISIMVGVNVVIYATESLMAFSVGVLALSLVFAAIGFPIAHRKFLRIEL